MYSKQNLSVKIKTRINLIYSFIFLFVVFFLLLSQIFSPVNTFDTISENYLWKKILIENYRQFKFVVGDRVFPYVVVGKEDWLFYTGEMSLRNYQKVDPLNISNIKKLLSMLNKIDEAVSSYGGTLLVVVPPDKSTVYPQYMPDEIPVIGTTTSLDRLIERAGVNSNFQLLDLRAALLNSSETSQVYYKTDSHWNCLGAYYAYEEIMGSLSKKYPNVQSYTLNDFEITYSRLEQFDIAKMMGVNIKDNVPAFTPKFNTMIYMDNAYGSNYGYDSLRTMQNTNKEIPNILVFHDSFYEWCLGSFIELSFGRTISVPYKDVELDGMLSMIEREKPDIVMVEFVERFMDYFLWHLYE